jgi:hypothetical protein
MKTGRELFEIWAPPDSIWSPWVSPVLFAQIKCAEETSEIADPPTATWHEPVASRENAIVLDLPGNDAVKLGLALARIGYRPVVAINASPGPAGRPATPTWQPPEVLDMAPVTKEICGGTLRLQLQQMSLPVDAPPAFILDGRRTLGTRPLSDELFDNRWMVFPQDFPSAKFLQEHGIQRVTLVQIRNAQPLEDLRHVLLRWQEAGIEIFLKASADAGVPTPIIVSRPSRFRAIWYRALVILGLRRSSAGGFGAYLSEFFGGG